MKILRKNEGLVSNFEMCELLKQRELKRHEQVGGGTEVGDEENNEFDNNNNNNNNTNSYDEGMPIDEHDDEEEDEEDEDDEFNVDDVEDVERHNLRDVVHKDSNHSYAPHARTWWKNGFVKKGALDDVAVVSPQKPPEGEAARNAFLSVGAYPCCKGKVYAENRTTIDLLNGFSCLGVIAFIYWIDSVLFSGNKTNAPFDFDRIGPILSKYPALRREFFLRFRHGVCALHRNRVFSQQNECVVCVLCGKDIAEQAFDRWVEAGFIINEDVLYSDNNHTVFRASFDFEGTTFNLLVVRCAYHPTAHLHAHGLRKLKKAHEGSCSVIAAAMAYAQKTTATTKKKTINEHLQSLNKAYVNTMTKRKERWRVLLQTDEYWLEVFVAKNSSWFQDAYARCRNMQLENDVVFQNAKNVFDTFGIELALKMLKTTGFASRLGQVGTSTTFIKKLLRVFEEYCDKNLEVFERFVSSGLFAHINDKNFFQRMDYILAKYCDNDPASFAKLACDSFFAIMNKKNFFDRIGYVFAKYCNKQPALLAKFACDCFFAHMNKDAFREALDIIFVNIFNNNHALLAQFVSKNVCVRIWKDGYADKLVSAFEKSELEPTQFAQIGGNRDFLDKLDSPGFDAAAYFSKYTEVNKWSDEEIERLDAFVKESGSNWNELAEKHFPTRNAKQLRERWNQLQEGKNTTKGSWSKDDDLELIKFHKIYPDKWKEIGSLMTKPRGGPQVNQRFNQAKSPKSKAASTALKEYALGYVKASGKKFKKWTSKEEEQFIEAYKETPKQWAIMSKKFPGRSGKDLIMKWQHASTATKKKPSRLEKFAREESQKAKDIGK
mmetsp:Transcript_3455/g.11681  ORF Transcript_3455/g.11681 Transcript_3455/m.11681 type:complete len:831 (+) Transcript_3455:150-2642(+)